MKSSHLFIGVAIIVLITIFFYSFNGSDTQHSYAKMIEQKREEKDQFMRTSSESPFASHPEDFEGLSYFLPNENYRIIATLVPLEKKAMRRLGTSDGKEKRYLEYAFAEFNLDGIKNRLLILEIVERGPYKGTLFLAFGDATSGEETYGAGRYLDLEKTPGSTTIELDFNLAYNPYCAYSNNYSCPFPPTENLLPIPLKAGEKIYAHPH